MFETYISLGGNCSVAASLAKYGLRSTSGPFDWCESSLEQGIIPFLENDFMDIMKYENLACDKEGKAQFFDIKHGIRYPHDLKESLPREYPDIFEKYQRRIQCFRDEIQKPVLFVRGVFDMKELYFIAENRGE